ncbi:hypothetical protein [Streptomyces sp. RKAG337]|uniref:hypothetical protein n=1 Tax=Streptomyces sp. RKAG337 TaxID=2893404 RepID=UPI0020335A59|nr:hypothetical protein [Streptomyces sp. RKAG337]MCM2429198.1 hypothetical protein [Streptomyces sp. RKAG337]
MDQDMTAQHAEHDGPLIPQPAMTREALREAVRRIALSDLAVLDRECAEAFDRAVQTQSTSPLRFFLTKWATFVAIERWPSRAAALHGAERISGDPHSTEEQFRSAMDTINRILAEAQQEIGL